MSTTVRIATQADYAGLVLLAHDLNEEHLKSGEPAVFLPVTSGIAHMLETGQAVVVAEDAYGLVGFCAWGHLPHLQPGELSGLGTYVKPGHRQAGLSEQMRDLATVEAQKRGYTSVTGVAVVGNHAGLESVLKLGFRVVGYLVRLEFGHGEGQQVEGREDGVGEELRQQDLLSRATGQLAIDETMYTVLTPLTADVAKVRDLDVETVPWPDKIRYSTT